MKKMLFLVLGLVLVGSNASACDMLQIRRDGDRIVCYRGERALSMADVQKRYEKWKPDVVGLKVFGDIPETEIQKIVSVIKKDGVKKVGITNVQGDK